MSGKIIYIIIFALYLSALALLCFGHFSTGIDFSSTLFGLPKDKIAHFAMFLPYPLITYMPFHKDSWSSRQIITAICLILISGAAIGGSIELLQGLTDYRSCDIMDFRADCIGLLCGSVILLSFLTIFRKEQHEKE